MRLRLLIRKITDALPKGRWIRAAAIADKLPEENRNSVISVLMRMERRGELKRRGTAKNYEYRSGDTPVTSRKSQKAPRPPERMGFAALARLEREDPKAYARFVDRERAGKR
jgi:hypothetical protein